VGQHCTHCCGTWCRDGGLLKPTSGRLLALVGSQEGIIIPPDVLNERPIFFRLYSIVLAIGYAGVRLYRGNSSLRIPVSKLPTTPTAEAKAQDTHLIEPIQTQLQRRITPALVQSASISGAAIVLAPFINGLFLRNILWQLHLTLAKPFFNLSRANARPIGYPPLGFTYLFHCLFAGFLLVLTWELTSILFLTYLNQEPTKSGLPLSALAKTPTAHFSRD